MDNLKNDLIELLENGPLTEIYYYKNACHIYDMIHSRRIGINEKHYGNFFGYVSSVLPYIMALNVSKMFDKPCKNYEMRTFYQIISFLEEHREELPVYQPGVQDAEWHDREKRRIEDNKMVPFHERQNNPSRFPNPSPDSATTCEVVKYINSGLKDNEKKILKVKYYRDKFIAHNEKVAVSRDELPEFIDMDELVDWAEDAVEKVMGLVVNSISLAYSEEAGYTRRPAICLGNILDELGIKDENSN